MNTDNFKKILNEIIDALKEKGYEPHDQLEGFLSLDDDSYITRHNGAREKIQNLDKDQISKYLKEQGR